MHLLGKLIKDYSEIVLKPLNNVISEVFGYDSEQGRHLREVGAPNYEEAELVVHLCTTLCTYLSKKNFKNEDNIEVLFE